VTKKKITKQPQEGEEVELSSLGTLQLFLYQGHIYSKRKVQSAGIKALSQEGDELITLPPDTLVTFTLTGEVPPPKVPKEPEEPEVPKEPEEPEVQ